MLMSPLLPVVLLHSSSRYPDSTVPRDVCVQINREFPFKIFSTVTVSSIVQPKDDIRIEAFTKQSAIIPVCGNVSHLTSKTTLCSGPIFLGETAFRLFWLVIPQSMFVSFVCIW